MLGISDQAQWLKIIKDTAYIYILSAEAIKARVEICLHSKRYNDQSNGPSPTSYNSSEQTFQQPDNYNCSNKPNLGTDSLP